MKYDYYEAIRDDVREYIKYEIDLDEWRDNRDGLEEKLNRDLMMNDSVTGNASGSYTFSRYKAEKYICHNLELLGEAIREFFDDAASLLERGAEACDVAIRCYLLADAIADVLNELEADGEFDEPDEEEDEEGDEE